MNTVRPLHSFEAIYLVVKRGLCSPVGALCSVHPGASGGALGGGGRLSDAGWEGRSGRLKDDIARRVIGTG